MIRWLVLLALCVLPGRLSGASAAQDQAPILAAAAISLTDVLEALNDDYGAQGHPLVRFNFAASNVLARQIVNGAPADVFISADEIQMDVVARAGAIVPETRVDLVGNRLAVVAPLDRADIVKAGFEQAAPAIRRLAIGDPAGVPAGRYAKAWLETRGLWRAYEPRIVPTGSVRAALAAVETGAVDAGIVYLTDVQTGGAALVLTVPEDQSPRIVYPAAVLRGSRQSADARRFLEYLRGPRAAAIFRLHRFHPLMSPAPTRSSDRR